MRLSLLGAAVLATTGCVSTNASLLNPGVTYQKICPNGVQIFTSAERVRSDYYEVAILNSKGESSWTDEKQMTASQRNKAARLGANGINLGEVKEPNAGTKIIGRATRNPLCGRYREERVYARALHDLHSGDGVAEPLLLPDRGRSSDRWLHPQ